MAAGSRASGVPGSTVSAYALRCGGRHVEAEHALDGVAPVVVALRRRAVDEVEVPAGKPAAADDPAAATASSQPWCRPSEASTWGALAWAPSETRVTPAAR